MSRHGRNRGQSGHWKVQRQTEAVGKCYRHKEIIGRETRNLEFKAAQGNIYFIIEHAPQYMCGFLNSGETGSLMIGVNDFGEVIGVKCGQKEEDDYKIMIDRAVKTIHPIVYPEDYIVEFIPIEGEEETRKVIKITTIVREPPMLLYSTKDKVYVRRDASLQELKPKDIQEWQVKRHTKDIHTMRNEVVRKDQTIKTMSAKLLEQKDEINTLMKQAVNHMNSNQSSSSDEGIKDNLQQIRTLLSEQAQHQAEVAAAAKAAAEKKNTKSKACVLS